MPPNNFIGYDILENSFFQYSYLKRLKTDNITTKH